MVIVSSILLVVFVVPFPLASFRRFYRVSRNRAVKENSAILSALRAGRELWWWIPVVLDGRRVLIAVFVSLLPWQSLAQVPTVSLVLLANLIGLMMFRPYSATWENWLDGIAVTVSSILFTLVSVAPSVIQIIATIFKISAILVVVWLFLYKKCECLRLIVSRFALFRHSDNEAQDSLVVNLEANQQPAGYEEIKE